MSAKRDLLRSYLLALLAEGKFSRASYGSMLEKAIAEFSDDAAAVMTELVAMGVLHGVERAGANVLTKLESTVTGFVAKVGRDGLGKAAADLWRALKSDYERGVTNKRR